MKFRSFPRETQHKGLTPELIPKAAGKISAIRAEVTHTKPEIKAPEEASDRGKPTKARKVDGMLPIITREQAQEIVEKRRKKKYGLFGEKEHLTGFGLEWVPLAYVEIALTSGMIMKGMKKFSFFLNCANGSIVDLDKGYRTAGSLGRLAECSENECAVLLSLRKGKNVTVAELEKATGLSESALRDITERLRKARFITWSKTKNVNYYALLERMDLPDFNRAAAYSAQEVEAKGEIMKPVFSEKDVRNVVKAMDRKAEIIGFKVFYYPFWIAHLQGAKLRAVRMDAVTGKEI